LPEEPDPRPRATIRHWIEYIPARVACWLFMRLPVSLARLFGRLFSFLFWHLVPRRRRVAIENIRGAFPEKSDAEVMELARAHYRHLGLFLADVVLVTRLRPENLDRYVDTSEQSVAIEEAMKRGKGVLFFTAHAGCWELAGAATSLMGYPVNAVGRPLDNPLIDRLVSGFREASGQKIISKFNALRGVLRALKRREIAAMLMDQDAGRQGIFVEFFGRICSTSDAVGRMAVRTGAPVIVSLTQRVDESPRHRFTSRILEVPLSGDARADAEEITRRATALLEEQIRQHPEQWLWVHRRWKTRPKESNKSLDAAAPSGENGAVARGAEGPQGEGDNRG
jgi:KDO2-lipid IV(A) lauroyltransferase